MIKTKEMHAGGFYLFVGKSSANSSFIEDKVEAMKFIKSCNEKLDGFLVIHDFLITKDGWQILVELNDEISIHELYNRKYKKSKKVKKGSKLDIVWKIISEQLRSILSNFVVFTNKKNGRKGSKVARSYERYWFESVEEAKGHLGKMRKQLLRMSQRLRKYRSGKSHYRIPEKLGKGAIFLCSLRIEKGMEVQLFGEGCLDLIKESLDVVRKLVERTSRLHSSNFHPKNVTVLE